MSADPIPFDPGFPLRSDSGLVFIRDSDGSMVADVTVGAKVRREDIEFMVYGLDVSLIPDDPSLARHAITVAAIGLIIDHGPRRFSENNAAALATLTPEQRATAADKARALFPELYPENAA